MSDSLDPQTKTIPALRKSVRQMYVKLQDILDKYLTNIPDHNCGLLHLNSYCSPSSLIHGYLKPDWKDKKVKTDLSLKLPFLWNKDDRDAPEHPNKPYK